MTVEACMNSVLSYTSLVGFVNLCSQASSDKVFLKKGSLYGSQSLTWLDAWLIIPDYGHELMYASASCRTYLAFCRSTRKRYPVSEGFTLSFRSIQQIFQSLFRLLVSSVHPLQKHFTAMRSSPSLSSRYRLYEGNKRLKSLRFR